MAAEFDGAAFPRIGLLWRGDPATDPYSAPGAQRLGPLVEALRRLSVTVVPVVYREDVGDDVRGQLLGLDGVMVWVNPIQDGVNRGQLDALLREAVARGVWVSADPEVILTLGTKEVLYRTRDVGWGAATDLYRVAADFRARMKRVLGLDKYTLPAIWDADFLYGPKTPAGHDTYVLCEINVSAVWSFPDQAVEKLAQAAVARVLRR